MTGDVFVTPHAVQQFIARIAPGLGYADARAAILTELQAHAGPAKPLASGRGIYVRARGGRYAFRAVLCRGEGSMPALVTILRSGR